MNYTKRTKRRIELYSFFDHTGIKKHLEKMSQKGWMLESISNLSWKYKKIPPSNLTFAVSYSPKASAYDPQLTPEQQDFLDFCAHTGWRLACTSGQVQIFYNARQNPIPIETEPLLEIEGIHKSAKRTFLPLHAILLALALFQLFLLARTLSDNPVDLLVSTSSLCTGFCWAMLFFTCIREISSYFLWYSKAKKAATRGEFLNVKGHLWLSRIIFAATMSVGICWIISLFTAKSLLFRRVGLLMLGYVPVLFLSNTAICRFLKHKQASRATNRAATILSSFLLAVAYIGCLIYLAMSGRLGDPKSLQQYAYDFPLTLQDLDGGMYDSYIAEKRGSESPFLEAATFRQHPDPWLDNNHPGKELAYTITTVKCPALYPLCKQSYLQQMEWLSGKNIREADAPKAVLQKQGASFWKAQEVYRQAGPYVSQYNWYILCYTDRIVNIHFSWEPTQAQLAVAAERLAAQKGVASDE